MRHGILAGESVCTENLTPWTKLLPCRVQAGLGKLLARVPPLLDSHYSSVLLHFRPVVPGKKYQLVATLTLVVPPDAADPSRFSVSKIFSSDGIRGCTIASSSKVHVLENSLAYTTHANTEGTRSEAGTLVKSTYDLKELSEDAKPLSVVVKFPQSDPTAKLKTVDWFDIKRWTAGWGLQGGQLAILISNKLNTTVDATLHQVIPWLMRLYLHSIRFTQDGRLLTPEDGAPHEGSR